MRPDDRAWNELRPIHIERNYTKFAEGAVLISFGDTKVLCTASVEDRVPAFLKDSGSGWVTAEYAMLPRSTQSRVSRDASTKGRALEISRLIGRSLRCVVDLSALGERQITLDCDVVQADGGTRTAAISGAYVALKDALDGLVADGKLTHSPLLSHCAAISVGLIEGEPRLDLCYAEDSTADVDLNLVMAGTGDIIEIQGSAEGDAFPRATLNRLIDLAEEGIRQVFVHQEEVFRRD